MSIDLATGILAITGLSVSASLVGRWVGLKFVRRRQLCFLVSLLLALGFAWSMAGRLFWAALLPTPSVVFWANLMPILLAFTAGISSTVVKLRHWGRPGTVVAMSLMTIAYIVTPVMRPLVAPALIADKSSWRDDVCLQSHPSTCAPAAAATLLRSAGIDATEQMLLEPCLTSEFGTEPLGLFRGLAVLCQTRRVQPTVVTTDPLIWQSGDQLPNLSLVRFEESESASQAGLIPMNLFAGPQGEGHAIVVLGRDPRGNWIILDPAFGRTLWSDETFRRRFTGDAISMRRVE